MNILSLFDGMSCGMIALEQANIKVDNYYASEIDKYAIKISQKNYPSIIQLGDIDNWKQWNLPKIDVIMGGSPCQGFSKTRKGINFKDKRSELFFKFVEVLECFQPKYFLLENVKMKKEWADIISQCLHIEPIEINSALVSAQNRKRYYWTNINIKKLPDDKNINIIDILDSESLKYPFYKKEYFYNQISKNKNSNSMCKNIGIANVKGHDILRRVYDTKHKAPTLTANSGGNQEVKIAIGKNSWRKLSPLENERLQTIPDNYTKGVSNTQRYKMLGNGWTVDVISHIFSYLPSEYKRE